MRDLDHPLIRCGGDWILCVLLVTALSALAGSAVLAHRVTSQAPDPGTLFLFRHSSAP